MHTLTVKTVRQYRTTDELHQAIKDDPSLTFEEKQAILAGAESTEISKGDGTNPDKYYVDVELGEDEPEAKDETSDEN